MVLTSDFIRVYDDVLDADVCDALMHIFDTNKDKHERLDEQKRPSFTQYNLTQNSEDHKDIHNHLIQKTFQYRDDYYEFVDKRVFQILMHLNSIVSNDMNQMAKICLTPM